LVVPESQMIPIRDALKPHRGEVYEYWLTIVDFWFLSRNFGMIFDFWNKKHQINSMV
jgi:hypothetical protein